LARRRRWSHLDRTRRLSALCRSAAPDAADLALDTDELVDFPWQVSDLGYAVQRIDRRSVVWTNSDLPGPGSLPAGSRYETPADMGDEEWPEPVDVLVRQADVVGVADLRRWQLPLRPEPRSRPAFLAFAKVLDTAAVTKFAMRHGMLGRAHRVTMPGGRVVSGELLRGWESARGWIDEATALRGCVSQWLEASGRGTADPEWADDAQQRRVHAIIRARLREDATADLLRHEGTGRSVLRLRPRPTGRTLAAASTGDRPSSAVPYVSRLPVVVRRRSRGRRGRAAAPIGCAALLGHLSDSASQPGP